MKTFTSILVLVVLGTGLWWWGEKNNMGEVAGEPVEGQSAELCFARFTDSPDSEFHDKYALRMNLEGESAEGRLRLLPAEKDALVGEFEGTVGAPQEPEMSRTANLIWSAEGEGMTAKQEMRIIFDSASARLGFGEMVLSDDGIYEYKDPEKVDYSFILESTLCEYLNEREAVEKYLWENIAKLSSIAPTVGGNWYVVAATVDIEKNTGVVTYEDGHVQEKRDFTYAIGADAAVESMTIE